MRCDAMIATPWCAALLAEDVPVAGHRDPRLRSGADSQRPLHEEVQTYPTPSFLLTTLHGLDLTCLACVACSPLLEKLLHIAPREMWPNADVVHKQIRDREKARLDEASAADRRKAAQQLRASQLQTQGQQQQQQQGLAPQPQKEAEEDDDDAESIEEDIATAAAPAAAPASGGKSSGGKAGKDKDKDRDKGRESKSRTGAKRR